MKELLSNYSLSEIIIFLVFLFLAAKEVISYIDWARGKNTEIFNKKSTSLKKEEQNQEQLNTFNENLQKITEDQQELTKAMQKISSQVDMLIDSDMEDIKSFLTREHHYFCYQKGWIDDYSLECCEHRFKYYKMEGGNSFIQGFMDDLRKLPKQPPRT